MARPKHIRQVHILPPVDYFKPRGIPMRELEEVALAVEEFEALRLADLGGLDQARAAQHMGVSRPTFARVVHAARAKVADALVNGKALRIEGGVFRLSERLFMCFACGNRWSEPFGTGRPNACPKCRAVSIRRVHVPGDGALRDLSLLGETASADSETKGRHDVLD